MKKQIVFVTLMSAFLQVSAYSQGKGPGASAGGGHIPSVKQGHTGTAANSHQTNAPKTDHVKADAWQTKMNDRFTHDAQFRTHMQALLPQGMDLKTAESGFKNHGQFIAALHVSQNLGIPFDQLKAKMTGITVDAAGNTTTSTPESLGKAIHELKPALTVDQSNLEAKKAEKQADETEKTTATTKS